MDYLFEFSFVQWLIEILEYLGFINPIEPDQEPLPMAALTVDASQQTDDREEKLNEETRYLQEELQVANEEHKRKADQQAFHVDTIESQYTSELTLDKIASIQEHLSTLDIVTEQSKWMVNYVLKQIKDEITSVTSYSRQLNEEKEKLIKDSQIIQSEMEAVKLALVDAKKTIADMEKLQSLWIVSESQMKTVADENASLLASKDAELNELRKALQQATLKSQLTSRDVGCVTEPSGQLDPTIDKIVSLQEHLFSIDIITEQSKWTMNYVLKQVKDEITSVTFYRPQPNQKEKLIKDMQVIQSEMDAVKLALADVKKTIADMEKLQSLWIVSESRMKTVADEKESLLASKDAELKELREHLQQATLKSQLTTRNVGCVTEPSGQLDPTIDKIVSLQEYLFSLDIITEHSKWTVNYVLEQIKN